MVLLDRTTGRAIFLNRAAEALARLRDGFHLEQVLAKTGARRQAELVRLVLGGKASMPSSVLT